MNKNYFTLKNYMFLLFFLVLSDYSAHANCFFADVETTPRATKSFRVHNTNGLVTSYSCIAGQNWAVNVFKRFDYTFCFSQTFGGNENPTVCDTINTGGAALSYHISTKILKW